MGSAIQFGIYRLNIILFFIFSWFMLQAQDYYLDQQGQRHEVTIGAWSLNHALIVDEADLKPLFLNQIQAIYRAQAELEYVPYSSLVKNVEYLDFLIPSVASLRALSIDYFVDEHLEVWLSNDYVVYHILKPNYLKASDLNQVAQPSLYQDQLNAPSLFVQSEGNTYPEITAGTVFLYHDSVGFNKVVADNMEDDYFRLQISKYTFNARMNDSIFSAEFKLKQKNFLSFFDEQISPLSAAQYNDQDLADFYISSLRNGGALVVLLNLDKRKIDLYRNSGNTKLADELEAKLNFENAMFAISFLDPMVFDFCKVYITDAKNRGLVLNGTQEAIFLNHKLEIDSSIHLEEKFVLFARKGQVFETQFVNSQNTQKKMVTSNPVVQDAVVIYDNNNIQVVDPFPNYVRAATASFSSKGKVKKTKKAKADLAVQNNVPVKYDDFGDLASALQSKYNLEAIDKNKLGVAYTFNNNFYKYYAKLTAVQRKASTSYRWKNTYNYSNGKWILAPSITSPRY